MFNLSLTTSCLSLSLLKERYDGDQIRAHDQLIINWNSYESYLQRTNKDDE